MYKAAEVILMQMSQDQQINNGEILPYEEFQQGLAVLMVFSTAVNYYCPPSLGSIQQQYRAIRAPCIQNVQFAHKVRVTSSPT